MMRKQKIVRGETLLDMVWKWVARWAFFGTGLIIGVVWTLLAKGAEL